MATIQTIEDVYKRQALKYDSVNKVNAIKKLERISSPGMRKYTGYKDMPVSYTHLVPCTVIEAGPCVVTQVKTVEKDGYAAVQLGFQDLSLIHI